MNIRWVRQEDERGCTVASLAMITGKTYAEVKAYFVDKSFRGEDGITQSDCDQYLAEHGYAVARKYRWFADRERDAWPAEPFGRIHLCQVTFADCSHMVVMLADGTVLDPDNPKPRRLTDYAVVSNVAAVTRLWE